MENLFTTLAGKLPAPKQEIPQETLSQELDISKLDNKTLVLDWQKNNKQEYASEILKRMRPTITSAINSYAPGKEAQLEVRAAKMTMEALRGYDPSYGTDPATHVYNNLKRLSRLSAQRSSIIPRSEQASAEKRLLMDAMTKFEDKNNREPSMAELADFTGLSRKKIDRLLNDNMVLNESATLSTDSGKDTQGSSDLTDDDYWEYVYASVGPVDQKIMEWTSGKRNKRQLSNNEIAAKLRVSPAAVSQRKARIQQLLSDARSLV